MNFLAKDLEVWSALDLNLSNLCDGHAKLNEELGDLSTAFVIEAIKLVKLKLN